VDYLTCLYALLTNECADGTARFQMRHTIAMFKATDMQHHCLALDDADQRVYLTAFVTLVSAGLS